MNKLSTSLFLTFLNLKHYLHTCIINIKNLYTYLNSVLQVDLGNQCYSRIPLCRKRVPQDTLTCNNNYFDLVDVQMCTEQDTMKTNAVRYFVEK